MNAVLAFDCGGTRTRAGLYDASGALVNEAESGPANPIAQSVDGASAQIAQLAATLKPGCGTDIALGIAGARTADTSKAIWAALADRFPETRILITDDQTPVLLANHGGQGAVLISAGTGSCVVAIDPSGTVFRKGGRGPLFGDDGSAYAIAVDALKHAARGMDGIAPETGLMTSLPASAGVRTFDDLIAWQRTAAKQQIAALAETVCTLTEEGDAVARACLEDQAALLAATAQAARTEAELDTNTKVLLNGGVFEHSAVYAKLIAQALQRFGFASAPALAQIRGHAAVRELAANGRAKAFVIDRVSDATDAASALPVTERKSGGPSLDLLDAHGIVHRMLQTNAEVDAAMHGAMVALAKAVERAADAIRAGGRIIYAGAGTSGRLAVLDAAECRPTFGVEPGRVVALIAGGETALVESVEEAEDSREGGRNDLTSIEPPVGANDFVLGITASGTTSYACAIIEQAAEQGARTALLTCNAGSPDAAPLMIRLATGPEALPGSTRLKAGTATKLALNIISTGAFARAGHIYGGWMVGVRPINTKLRARAVRILVALTQLDDAAAQQLLDDAGNRIPVALVMNQFQLNRADAAARLQSANDDLHAVLDE